VTALAHAVVCRRRYLSNNQISTIANGAFAGLTALTDLYGAGLWVRVIFGSRCLVLAWMRFPRAYLRPAFFHNRTFTLFSRF
jgi:hypothetical protein